jgi:NAD(P)-dependent dehydrogenase (short-subunit alcohol dehydrogenase family)
VRYLAAELAADGVTVNAVCGGPVETDSLRSFAFFAAVAEESRRRACGRIGQPEDIAPVVTFLLSPAARWIRGQIIVADGGFSLH